MANDESDFDFLIIEQSSSILCQRSKYQMALRPRANPERSVEILQKGRWGYASRVPSGLLVLAAADVTTVHHLVVPGLYHSTCYHAQQAAEKALKESCYTKWRSFPSLKSIGRCYRPLKPPVRNSQWNRQNLMGMQWICVAIPKFYRYRWE
ncbi:hypothetical protein BXT84_09235 [Sulfobacillus thermotolerans]|uniref:HEPN domain-containing protein n=1 Tax=Sulfobacillus thermotolerans TaxID=338644 RepID=A0ABN5H0N3_9FIRM|nr:hypothetical protein BXT84_09235 [Sulfobacillus thermotolerans]